MALYVQLNMNISRLMKDQQARALEHSQNVKELYAEKKPASQEHAQ
jgi:hypothetical protein